MTHIKRINEVFDIDYGFEFSNMDFKKEDPKDPNVQKLVNMAKGGNLYRYLASGQRNLTFGMLKALHQDAITFKEQREFKQGIDKFLFRAVPLALAPIFFPVWLLSQILGATRALNKILMPVLKIKQPYGKFLEGVVIKVMDITEGEFERLMVDDWFYKSFAVQKGLIQMVRKEHIVKFAYYISKKMQYEDDDRQVPPYYIENEFRRYLNRNFRIDPQLPIKKKRSKRD